MKISKYLQKKVIPEGFLANLIILAVGVIIFNFMINNKTISGTLSLIIISIAYLVTGVGVVGLIKYLVRLILWGNVEMTITKEKVSFKTRFNK